MCVCVCFGWGVFGAVFGGVCLDILENHLDIVFNKMYGGVDKRYCSISIQKKSLRMTTKSESENLIRRNNTKVR